MFSSQFKFPKTFTTKNERGLSFFNSGKKIYMQSKINFLIRNNLADKQGEKFRAVDGFLEAIEVFEAKSIFFHTNSLTSLKDDSSFVKVLKLLEVPQRCLGKPN